jgi:hypothetical protein
VIARQWKRNGPHRGPFFLLPELKPGKLRSAAAAGEAHDLAGTDSISGVRLHAVEDFLRGEHRFDVPREYIQAFIAATAAPATREEAMAKLKAAYPDYALPMIVEYSVGGRIK